ncbi:hypothetical protein fugu_018422 [Takifugu bimaculatus]|uniref:Annexin n=1 Tax=Takifugu bimaculatus TaxID=433685 RepID=A0A4Z2BP41_9TELE|nr:hypothetical protein fugu_018422 [Takifugu bimaculatus]
MSWGTLGTVRPFPNFHPERDAVELQAALEKKDTVTLVRILTNRSNAQRQVLAQTFEDITQKDLEGAVKKAVTGDLAALLLSLLMPPQEHDAYRFQQAMAGLGTDEETLIEILSMRSRKQLDDISAAYTFLYKKDLEKELRGETSGDFAKLVVALLHTLLIAVNSKKADGKPWIDMLTSRDPEHLKRVLAELEVECGQNMDHIFEKRFSGDFRLGLKVLVVLGPIVVVLGPIVVVLGPIVVVLVPIVVVLVPIVVVLVSIVVVLGPIVVVLVPIVVVLVPIVVVINAKQNSYVVTFASSNSEQIPRIFMLEREEELKRRC